MKEFGQLVNLNFIGFNELFLMFENGLLEGLIHRGGCCLNLMHKGGNIGKSGC